jgi:hypothetical protein
MRSQARAQWGAPVAFARPERQRHKVAAPRVRRVLIRYLPQCNDSPSQLAASEAALHMMVQPSNKQQDIPAAPICATFFCGNDYCGRSG